MNLEALLSFFDEKQGNIPDTSMTSTDSRNDGKKGSRKEWGWSECRTQTHKRRYARFVKLLKFIKGETHTGTTVKAARLCLEIHFSTKRITQGRFKWFYL